MSAQSDLGVYLQGYREDQQDQQDQQDQLHPTAGPKMKLLMCFTQMLTEVEGRANSGVFSCIGRDNKCTSHRVKWSGFLLWCCIHFGGWSGAGHTLAKNTIYQCPQYQEEDILIFRWAQGWSIGRNLYNTIHKVYFKWTVWCEMGTLCILLIFFFTIEGFEKAQCIRILLMGNRERL